MPGADREEGRCITDEFLAELHRTRFTGGEQLVQSRPALRQWLVAQILAIQVQKVKVVENQTPAPSAQGLLKRLEIGDAATVLDNHLTVKDGSSAG